MSNRTPVIGVPADRRQIGPHQFSAVGEKYILAVSRAAKAMPVLLPVTPDGLVVGPLLELLDGLMFTGSPSNVEPQHYQGTPSDTGTLHDPERDALTLPLIPKAVQAGIPVLGLCRGFQEINVAYGGSLHQKVHEVPDHNDHREDTSAPLDDQYGPAHAVSLVAGGLLAEIAGADWLQVNSLHSQGVERLGDGLIVEATAEDGLIEAFRIRDAAAFAVAVQWHPEWQVMENPFSRALFERFGDACRTRRSKRS